MIELAVAVSMLASLILYVLTGGADFGGGIWDLLAIGKRASQQRSAIAYAIGPIWEANHVWLILVVVLMFTGFPAAFSGMMTALNIPLTAMLVGIVFRGAAFIFRKYDSPSHSTQLRWSRVFGIACVLVPISEGMIIGALTTGQIHIMNGRVASGFFAGWLSPFAFACGAFALVLFAFLAAVYLTVDSKDQPDLQNDFRLRAMWSGLALAPIAVLVLIASEQSAPELYNQLGRWWALLMLTWTSVLAIGTLVALWRRWFVLARLAAICQATLIVAGWCVAQYPYLIVSDVTVHSAHAPEFTLRLLMLALGLGAIVLLPSMVFLFHLFKGDRSP